MLNVAAAAAAGALAAAQSILRQSPVREVVRRGLRHHLSLAAQAGGRGAQNDLTDFGGLIDGCKATCTPAE
jgi:hypothetical protein